MAVAEATLAKGIGTIMAAVFAFFGVKTVIQKQLEKELRLRLDLVNADILHVKEESRRLEKELGLRLIEKEHSIMCEGMQKEIAALKGAVEDGFALIHKRISNRVIKE